MRYKINDKKNLIEKISVVIPCYNSGRTLERTLASVFEQTWKNLEVIVVNDGSTDKLTKTILKSINKAKIINQINKGLPSARNLGANRSTGKYIIFLDADDWLEDNAIEKMYKGLKKTNSDYVFCDSYLEGSKSGKNRKHFNLFEQLFLNHIPYFVLIKKSILLKIGGYDENMTLGYEDWELNLRLGKNGYYPQKINEFLFHYNVSPSGMLNSISKKEHALIANYIKNKHKNLYSFKSMIKIYIEWRKAKQNYK